MYDSMRGEANGKCRSERKESGARSQ
jgi:hypothetical protein